VPYQSWWEQLSASCDRDGDGRITLAEFITAHLGGQGDPGAYYRQQVSALVSIVAGAVDADGDGFIGQAEYAKLLRVVARVSDQVALAGFARLDQDGDGRISTQEFQAGVADFFLSQDAADPGTAILGLA
jgi:Ca2+-binding EF-hand superfamily protein